MLSVKELFEATSRRYQMKLVAGEKGLSRDLAWVQLCEEVDNTDFFRGYDLIITTGLECDGADWLLGFLRQIAAHGASGLIINTGKYIKPQDISAKVKAFCEQESFPLFTMPWHIRMGDVMQDYCERLFQAEHREADMAEMVRRAIFMPEDAESLMGTFRLHGMEGRSFVLLLLSSEAGGALAPEMKQLLLLACRTHLSKQRQGSVAFWQQEQLLVQLLEPEESQIRQFLAGFAATVKQRGLKAALCCGVSNAHDGLAGMLAAYREAAAALALCSERGAECLFFNELGPCRLLFAVQDKELMRDMCAEELGELMAYDQEHHTQLCATLRAYLMAGCSLQGTAEATFTHRNTVSYRLGKIRELLGDSLDTAEGRFNLMLAYYMKDFLEIK